MSTIGILKKIGQNTLKMHETRPITLNNCDGGFKYLVLCFLIMTVTLQVGVVYCNTFSIEPSMECKVIILSKFNYYIKVAWLLYR